MGHWFMAGGRMRKPCEGSAMSDFSEGHYKHKAKNKFMKAAAQQAQQPLKGVVKAAVQEAHARTTCYKHTAASIAGLVHTGMTDTDRIWVGIPA